MFSQGKPEESAHSWRDQTTEIMVLDVFYDPLDKKAHEFAKNWAEKNDLEASGCEGIYSEVYNYIIDLTRHNPQ